jgi:hypothetical protein
MQPSSDSLRVVRLTKQTMPFHVHTGDKCQSEPFPCVGIPSIPRSSHPHDCRAEITIVRTCHELVLTAKTNDAIRVDYASYWSVTYSSLSPPISICLLRVSLLLFLYLFCTISYAFSGASPIDPRNLVDLPHFRLSTHLLYASFHHISIFSPPQPSSPTFVSTTARPGAGRLLDQIPAIV